MWTEDWNQSNKLKDLLESRAAEGSVVLVTTRSTRVASMVSGNTPTYELTHLSSEDCWSIFSRIVIIRQWMALNPLHLTNEAEEFEDVGNRYFDELLSRSFFQDPELDWEGVVWTCKMHDLVHKLAASVAGDEQVVVNNEKQLKDTKRARHISWSDKELLGKEFPKEQLLEAARRV
ncbi:hypothetical protein Ancab_031122 [Ancistrocladus abbreviatus]